MKLVKKHIHMIDIIDENDEHKVQNWNLGGNKIKNKNLKNFE